MNNKTIFERRRSVAFFDKDKEIDKDLLKQIIDTASLAPSAFNLQPWRLISVESDEAKKRLFDLAMKQEKVLKAPVILILVADYEGYGEGNPVWAEKAKNVDEDKLKGSQSFAAQLYGSTEKRKIKFAESNAGLFGMSIMYAAQHFGVDSHPMSGIDFDGIKEEFNLKKSEEPVMLICLGYFDESQSLKDRENRRLYNKIVETV